MIGSLATANQAELVENIFHTRCRVAIDDMYQFIIFFGKFIIFVAAHKHLCEQALTRFNFIFKKLASPECIHSHTANQSRVSNVFS